MLYYLTFRANKVNKPWGISTVGRTKFSDVRPTLKAVNGESAQNSSGIFGALAQLVARYIRIVEVSGSNPLCSTNSSGVVSHDDPASFSSRRVLTDSSTPTGGMVMEYPFITLDDGTQISHS